MRQSDTFLWLTQLTQVLLDIVQLVKYSLNDFKPWSNFISANSPKQTRQLSIVIKATMNRLFDTERPVLERDNLSCPRIKTT